MTDNKKQNGRTTNRWLQKISKTDTSPKGSQSVAFLRENPTFIGGTALQALFYNPMEIFSGFSPSLVVNPVTVFLLSASPTMTV
jgi:hypothetical protein